MRLHGCARQGMGEIERILLDARTGPAKVNLPGGCHSQITATRKRGMLRASKVSSSAKRTSAGVRARMTFTIVRIIANRLSEPPSAGVRSSLGPTRPWKMTASS